MNALASCSYDTSDNSLFEVDIFKLSGEDEYQGAIEWEKKFDICHSSNYSTTNADSRVIDKSGSSKTDIVFPNIDFPNEISQKRKNELTILQISEKEISIVHFIFNLKQKQKKLSSDRILDYVFDSIDDMLLEEKFSQCNRLLTYMNAEEYTVDVLVGVLTITAPWSNRLESRNYFYHNVEKHLIGLYSFDRAKSILQGLE